MLWISPFEAWEGISESRLSGSNDGHSDISIDEPLPRQLSVSLVVSWCSGAGIRFCSENPSQDYNRFPSCSFSPAIPGLPPPAAERRNLWGWCPIVVSAALQTTLQFSLLKCHLVIVSNTDRQKSQLNVTCSESTSLSTSPISALN